MSVRDSLIEQYKILHRHDEGYGDSSMCHYPLISTFLNLYKPHSLLDFGCGKSSIAIKMKEKNRFINSVCRYDPAISGIDRKPSSKFDCAINTDVLEHIPESDIESFLLEIQECSELCIFVIHLDYAHAILPNGDNAHCTVKTRSWWINKIKNVFKNAYPVVSLSRNHCAFVAGVAKPKHLIFYNTYALIRQVLSRRSFCMLKSRIDYYA